MTERLSTHRQSVAQTQDPCRQQPSVGTPSVSPPPPAQLSYDLKVGGEKRGRISPTRGVAHVKQLISLQQSPGFFLTGAAAESVAPESDQPEFKFSSCQGLAV